MNPCCKSLVTPSAIINEQKWAITLVCDKRNKLDVLITFHTRLIFECFDLKAGGYFFRVAHLRGSNKRNTIYENCWLFGLNKIGTVLLGEMKLKEQFKIMYAHKTPTWIVQRNKIEKLLFKIEQEANKPYPFIFFGDKFFLSKEAETYRIYDPLLAEIENFDKNLFLRLSDSFQNELKCTGMSKIKFDQSIDKAIGHILKIKPHLIDPNICYGFDHLVKLFDKEFVEQENLIQQSCFTWAKQHLQSIGIELQDYRLDSCISVSLFHATCKVKDEVSREIAEEKEPCESEIQQTMCGRLVTYDRSRDKRTENWKSIKKEVDKQKKINNVGKVAFSVGVATYYSSFFTGIGLATGVVGATITAPVTLPTLAFCAIGGLTATVSGAIMCSLSSKKIASTSNRENRKLITSAEEKELDNTIDTSKNHIHNFINRQTEYLLN